MASSPIYRATPELNRYRSSYSVPVQSRDISRSETPGSGRGSKSFFNRQVTPSTSRSHSIARDDIASIANHRQRVASVGKLFETWDEVERRHKNVWLEDDDEVDLETETVHKSDGSVAPWCPDEGQSPPDWARDKDGSPKAGPSRPRMMKHRSQDTEDDTNSDNDSHDDIEDAEEDKSEEEEDDFDSWRDQEEEMKAQLEHRKAALLLASLRSRPEQTSDEEMENFLRDEEEARARRVSARMEGRDSRCHTDKLSESEESEESGVDSPPLEYRSPSRFTTVVADKIEDLFSDDESSEDELALPSSDVEPGNGHSSSGGSASEDQLHSQSASILARAREVRSTWLESSSSLRAMTFPLSPDSSPEPEIIAEHVRPVSPVIPRSLRAKQRMVEDNNAQPLVATIPLSAHKVARRNAEPKLRDEPRDEPINRKNKRDKGKSRMAGERPTDPPVSDDVFGPAETIDINNLDRRRYRRSRYRQKASMAYKACRYCRYAEPARAKLAEYCRGANHSKLCTFEFPPKILTLDMDTEIDVDKISPAALKDQEPDPEPFTAPIEATPPATARRSGLTSNGLEKWRYFENLVKRPDKQTDRSCPYCRASDDAIRVENSTYCRGRIESRDCTFDGHKGNLRKSSKKRQPREKEKVTPSQPFKPPTGRTITPKTPIASTMTPQTPTVTANGPDSTVDETKLDIKLYYTSLIQSQLQNGYRFCPDCARSDDPERKRLSYWCRGRISFKACGYWNGDDTGHRQPGRHSTPGSKIKSAPIDRIVETTTPDPPRQRNYSTPASDQREHAAHGVDEAAAAIPPRKRGRPRKSYIPNANATEPPVSAINLKTTPISTSRSVEREQGPQTEPIKRRPGRPRKTALPESEQVQVPASEPIKRKPGRPKKISLSESQQAPNLISEPIEFKSSRPTTAPPQETSSDLSGVKKRKRGRPRLSANKESSRHENEVSKQTPDESDVHHMAADAVRHAEIDMASDEETGMPTRTPRVWPGWVTSNSRGASRPIPRKKRSRTFDVVVPASRSTTPAPSPTYDNGIRRDRHVHGPVLPVSAMRNTHLSEETLPHYLSPDVGVRELDSLPPSSPPTSLSPSPSPEPIRYMPSGHRSSPLASIRQHNRSSSALSETSMPIRGILRQSSEAGDVPRKRARVSFSLIRSPSPAEESEPSDVDSDSSDDILLLVDPSSASRRSAPPSSRRNGSSSPFAAPTRFEESPQAGRLSSSTLAAYARPLDRLPSIFGNASGPNYTSPQAPRSLTSYRSSLSTPPITSRSVPPSSGRGLMRPPPVPEYRLAPVPQSEPRPRVAIQRARTAVPASRSHSSPMSSRSNYQQPGKKLVAENIVIRRLINDVS